MAPVSGDLIKRLFMEMHTWFLMEYLQKAKGGLDGTSQWGPYKKTVHGHAHLVFHAYIWFRRYQRYRSRLISAIWVFGYWFSANLLPQKVLPFYEDVSLIPEIFNIYIYVSLDQNFYHISKKKEKRKKKEERYRLISGAFSLIVSLISIVALN